MSILNHSTHKVEIAGACVCVCVACINACVYVRVFQCIRYVTASGSVRPLTLFEPDPSLVLSGMQNICSKDDGTKAQRPSGAGSSTPAGTEGPVLAASDITQSDMCHSRLWAVAVRCGVRPPVVPLSDRGQ